MLRRWLTFIATSEFITAGDDVDTRFRSSFNLPHYDHDDDGEKTYDDVAVAEVDDAPSRWNDYCDYFDIELWFGRLHRAPPLLSPLLFIAAGRAVEVGGAERVVGDIEPGGRLADLASEGHRGGGELDAGGIDGANDWRELEYADRYGGGDAVIVTNCYRECVVIYRRYDQQSVTHVVGDPKSCKKAK